MKTSAVLFLGIVLLAISVIYFITSKKGTKDKLSTIGIIWSALLVAFFLILTTSNILMLSFTTIALLISIIYFITNGKTTKNKLSTIAIIWSTFIAGCLFVSIISSLIMHTLFEISYSIAVVLAILCYLSIKKDKSSTINLIWYTFISSLIFTLLVRFIDVRFMKPISAISQSDLNNLLNGQPLKPKGPDIPNIFVILPTLATILILSIIYYLDSKIGKLVIFVISCVLAIICPILMIWVERIAYSKM